MKFQATTSVTAIFAISLVWADNSPPEREQHSSTATHANSIIGTWVASNHKTEWGEMRFEFSFYPDGYFDHKMTPTDKKQGDGFKSRGRYQIKRDRLEIDVSNKKLSYTIHVGGNVLIVKYAGEPAIQFQRLEK